MYKYYELLTDDDLEVVIRMHPKEAKLKLATIMVTQYHSLEAAEKAKAEFRRVFGQKEIPRDIPEYKTDGNQPVVAILVNSGLVKSGNEARRLIQQGGLIFDGAKITDDIVIKQAGILKVGSRRFLKITL
jgi:tyrosyl-tRNA synthetase